MKGKRTCTLVTSMIILTCGLALTALAGKPVKPPPGPPTPPVTPGMVLINATDTSTDQANGGYLDAAGNIVFCGRSLADVYPNFLTGRLTPDGVLDTSFGSGGLVTTAILDKSQAVACAPQSDEKLIVVGNAKKDQVGLYDWDAALVGYNYDGSLNKCIGDVRCRRGGIVVTDIIGGSGVDDVAIQSDDKVVVVGTSEIAGPATFYALRFTADGFVDNSFGTDGFAFIPIEGANGNSADAVAIHGDGIVLGGYVLFDGGDVAVLIRLDANGDLDPDFGDLGLVAANFPGYSCEFADIAVDRDGYIVAAGIAWSQDSGTDILIARFDPSGDPDPSFGAGAGFVVVDLGLAGNTVNGVAIDPGDELVDDKIVVVGQSNDWSDEHQFVVRVDCFGSFDTTFAGTGWVRTEILGSSEARSVSIQPDGKIVTIGAASDPSGSYATVVRYNGDGSLDTTFNPED